MLMDNCHDVDLIRDRGLFISIIPESTYMSLFPKCQFTEPISAHINMRQLLGLHLFTVPHSSLERNTVITVTVSLMTLCTEST